MIKIIEINKKEFINSVETYRQHLDKEEQKILMLLSKGPTTDITQVMID